MAEGLYIFCVACGSREEELGIKGFNGGRIFTVCSDGLSAVVQEADQSMFACGEDRTAEWVMAHQAVVDLAWERYGTVVPFSFGTIVVPKDGKSTRENLLEWLGREGQLLKERMEKLKGRAEYGVQISWDPQVIASKVTRNDEEIVKLENDIKSKGPGTAYLMKQKLEGILKQRLEIAANAYFKEFFQKIKGCTEDVKVEKVRKEDPPKQMLMNISCLMMTEDASNLGSELDRIGRIEGIFVRFTGPWPPYSFVNL